MWGQGANMAWQGVTDSDKSRLGALPWKRGNTTELAALLENLVRSTTAPSIGLEDVLSVVQLEAQAAWFPVGFSLRDAGFWVVVTGSDPYRFLGGVRERVTRRPRVVLRVTVTAGF